MVGRVATGSFSTASRLVFSPGQVEAQVRPDRSPVNRCLQDKRVNIFVFES